MEEDVIWFLQDHEIKINRTRVKPGIKSVGRFVQ